MNLYINANRTGYSPCQIQHTMTVGELIAALEEFDEDNLCKIKGIAAYSGYASFLRGGVSLRRTPTGAIL